MAKQSHPGRWIGLALGLGGTAAVGYLIYRAKRGVSHFGPVTATVTINKPPLEVYDPTRENVLAHERVNEVVMRDFTVIPMSFSTVFKTSEDIVELLRSAYDAFLGLVLGQLLLGVLGLGIGTYLHEIDEGVGARSR